MVKQVSNKKTLSYIENYIKALVINVNTEKLPDTCNIIFDGGAFNAFYAVGVALYIKELERKGLKINKVSGCSAGAGVALNFLMGDFRLFESIFQKLVECFRKKHNIEILQTVIRENVYYLCKDDDESLKPLQNKLFINYYDIVEKKQKVVSTYQSRDELIDYLIRSSYIPYIIDGHPCYKDRYIDGVSPYIINDNYPNLFVQLVSKGRIARCFKTKSEKNAHYRIISGVSEANDFFTSGHSNMCSYMCNWSKPDMFLFRCRSKIIFTMIHFIYIILSASTYLSEFYITSPIFAQLKNILYVLCDNMIGRVL